MRKHREELLPCPVCLDVELTKRVAAPGGELVLDCCDRCGGIWFDAGEVMKLRSAQSPAVWRRIVLPAEAYQMPCHSCGVVMDRNAAECPTCGWRNLIDCPVCARTMERREVQNLDLDFCAGRHGVWFDRIELAEIWNLQVPRGALQTPPGDPVGDSRSEDLGTRAASGDRITAMGVAEIGLEALNLALWNPDLAVAGARAVGSGARAVASAATELAVEAPEVLGTVVETTGEVADGVFEAIFIVIDLIFS